MAEDNGPRKPRGLLRRMTGLGSEDGAEERSRSLSQMNLAFSLGVASLLALYLGYLFGRWVDRMLGTAPFGMFGGVLLGVGASFKMIITDILEANRSSQKKEGPPEDHPEDRKP